MPILAFSCSEGHETEKLVRSYDVQEIPCPACSGPASRKSVYRVAVTGFARAPVSQREIKTRDFTEASAELEYAHQRAEQREGREIPPPPLWQTAKREARRLRKLGVKDSLDLR